MKHPARSLKHKAACLGICMSMSDTEILKVLEEANVVKASREHFLLWLRSKYGRK